jgi:ABC-type nickel/cobalt efflux system permease component RcnA
MESIAVEFSSLLSTLHRELAMLFRELRDGSSPLTIAIIFGISLVYGVVHSLGPGHGKLLISSYLINRGGGYRKAFKLGFSIAVIHSISALLTVLVLKFVLESAISSGFREMTEISTAVSGVLIVLIGFYLLYENFRGETEKSSIGEKSDFAIAFSAGAVPCPGVMTIVLFSMAVSQLYVGVISAVIMSIGMGVTVSIMGIVATKIGSKFNGSENLVKILSILSSLVIILLGLFLLSPIL